MQNHGVIPQTRGCFCKTRELFRKLGGILQAMGLVTTTSRGERACQSHLASHCKPKGVSKSPCGALRKPMGLLQPPGRAFCKPRGLSRSPGKPRGLLQAPAPCKDLQTQEHDTSALWEHSQTRAFGKPRHAKPRLAGRHEAKPWRTKPNRGMRAKPD